MPRDIDLALQQALSEGDSLDAVRRLLSHKADPNTRDELGRTPLFGAVDRDGASLCQVLLLYQADPLLRAHDGTQPIESAAPDGPAAGVVRAFARGEVAAVLMTLEQLVEDAVAALDASMLSVALASLDISGGDAGRCARQQDEHGFSLLHLAATRPVRTPEEETAARLTVQALLSWGLPVDGRNDFGEPPLLVALRSMLGLPEEVLELVRQEPARALLQAGASPEASQRGETLLMLAVRHGSRSVCSLLLQFRADPLRRSKVKVGGELRELDALALAAESEELLLVLRAAAVSRPQSPGRGRQAPGAELPREEPGRGTDPDSGEDEDEDDRQGGEAWEGAGVAGPQPRRHTTPSLGPPICTEPEPFERKRGLSSPTEFLMKEPDEQVGAEGILNQLDFEDVYDNDWSSVAVSRTTRALNMMDAVGLEEDEVAG